MLKNKNFLVALGVAVIGIAAGSIFFFGSVSVPNTQFTIGEPRAYAPAFSGREVPVGQKEYFNPNFGFSVLYPEMLDVKEYPESGGGMTITFEHDDGKEIEGFQIFATPFSGDQITDARFKQDNPSGVRTGLKNITVAGATGASFYSKNDALGDTAEVWFVHGGYLYEVTTFKELAPWLSDILATWAFI